MSESFSYDVVPYPGLLFGQTHPDLMSTLASYLGIAAADPARCRVLELGCGDGSNLLAFAAALPHSEFIGVDLSDLHIASANQSAAEMEAKNLSFRQQDILDLDLGTLGEFDFIIAHGFYSWVPVDVREKALEIYSRCLAPNGIGFVSFNAYPGYKMWEMFRDMMRFHTVNTPDPMEKVSSGIDILRKAGASAAAAGMSQFLFQSAFRSLSERHPQNIFHDEFAPINQPFYFHEFVDHLKAHGLRFLAESAPLSPTNPSVSAVVDSVIPDGASLETREQYVDFIECRSFRNLLICRDGLDAQREPANDIVQAFYIASGFQPAAGAEGSGLFRGPNEESLKMDHPLTAAALSILGSIWSRSLPFDALVDQAGSQLGEKPAGEDVSQLAENLLYLFEAGRIEFHRFQADFTTAVPERPRLHKVARLQVEKGYRSISTMGGFTFTPDDDLVRLLLMLADGTRTREKLISELGTRVQVPEERKAEFAVKLPEIIDTALSQLAARGLFT
ncbi:MAG: class I SAM-dependent methyltransferase [Acidobacteriota bacterium]